MESQPNLRLSTLTKTEVSRTLDRLCLCDVGDQRPSLSAQYVSQLSRVLDSENRVSVLRFCRWAAAFSPSNQALIFEHLADKLVTILKTDEDIQVHCLALQVIGNTLVGNEQNCEVFLAQCGLELTIKFVTSMDPKISDTSSMVGLILSQAKPKLVQSQFRSNDLSTLLDNCESSSSHLWLECLLKGECFIPTHYASLSRDYKVKLLELIISSSVCMEGLPNESVLYLTELLASMSETILNSKGDVFPEEVTSLVELFCKLVLVPIRNHYLQSNPAFVTSVILLLRAIHDAGQASQNTFTPIHKMDQIQNQDLQAHPAYAFKANLIRLVGSLVQGNTANQDKVFDLGALRVILECTKIDALNPFMPQCAILALKFLLENNPRNQSYVKELSGEGFIPLQL